MTELETVRKQLQAEASKEARRYTQAEVAKAMGVSRPTYIKLERDPKRFTAEQMDRLADYFGMEPEELFSICRGM